MGRGPAMLTTLKRRGPAASEAEPAAFSAFRSAALPTPVASLPPPDDLSREVYCILGVPVDAIGMQAVLRRIESAADRRTPFLISAPNLNSLVISRSDKDFRESLVLSDLCTADGMPILWIARLAGIPIKELFALFPGKPAKKMAYIAGLPKPRGCV